MCERKSMKSRGINYLELIPTDVIMDILSRLPSKSIARFRSVSKLWGSILGSPYFNELFKTKSRPRLLFVLKGDGEWLFYSSPQLQNPYDEKSSLVVAVDYQTKFRGLTSLENKCSHAFGLVCCSKFICTSNKVKLPMICNPITGQYVTLPKLDDLYRNWTCFLGFDPIDKRHKVLAEAYPFSSNSVHHKILTLGPGKLRWRKTFHCPRYSRSLGKEICIDGVLYYLAEKEDDDYVIVCFDLRSEKFKLMDANCVWGRLVNYKGKLGGIGLDYGCKTPVLRMCVLEDVEKQEWSKSVFPLWENRMVDRNFLIFAGMTATGEIVLAMDLSFKPFYVYYFNPERNTLKRIEIQGFEAFESGYGVFTYVDYAEDLSQSSLLHMHLPRRRRRRRR